MKKPNTKPNTSIVAIVRYATFALTLAGTLSVFAADRKWTAGGGNDTDWTNDANWDSGTGTRLFYQDNWNGKAIDNTINVSFTNRTTESGNAFFIQSKTDTVVFNAASDEAGLDITVPNSGNWWVQNFYVGTDAHNGAWVVNGGTYSIGGGSLYIGHNGNNKAATGEVTVNGATLNLYEDLLVGSGGTGTLTITNGGTVVCQSSSAGGKWVKLGDNGSSGANIINLEEGGTLMIWHIEQTSANSSSTVNFNGGTLTAIGKDSNNCRYLLGNTDSGHTVSPIVNILSKGGTIESVAGVDAVVTTPLVTGVSDGVDGGLIKAGAGGLTLAAAANTYTGPTVVEGGSLVLPVGGSLASTKLELAGGTFSGTTFDDITISAGAYSFSSLPTNTTSTVTLNGGVLRMTVAEAQATADTATVVVNGGTLLIDGNTAESVSVGSSFTFANVTLGDNVEVADVVKVSGVNFDWTYGSSDRHPTATAGTASGENVWVGGATGNWSDAANWSYGVPTSGQTVVFDTDAVVTLSATANVGTLSNANSTVQFRTSDVSNIHPTIFVSEKVSGKGTFQFYHVGIISATSNKDCPVGGGEDDDLTLEVLACSSDSWFEGSSSNGPLAIYAKMKSEGKIVFRRDVRLYGDNSGCTGAIECNGTSGKMYFANTNAGSANATWSFSGDVYLGATATDGNFTGTISFGTLNTSGTATLKVNTAVSGVVIEVGAGTWGNQYFLVGQDFSTGNYVDVVTKDVTLKKVGTGTLTYNGFGIPKIEVAEGVFSLGTPNTSLTHYSHTYTTIDSLTVAEGAVLTGSGTRTVTNTTLESGAILRQSIAASGNTYTCPTLTIYGPVAAAGAVLTLVDSNDYLASAVATTENLPTFTLLEATSVTGKPTGTVEMATSGWGWQAKVRESNTKLVMIPGPTNPGLIIIFR